MGRGRVMNAIFWRIACLSVAAFALLQIKEGPKHTEQEVFRGLVQEPYDAVETMNQLVLVVQLMRASGEEPTPVDFDFSEGFTYPEGWTPPEGFVFPDSWPEYSRGEQPEE